MTEHSQVVVAALAQWGLDGADVALVAARENHVYRVDHRDGRWALRLHRPGYRSDAELRSELMWMQAVARGGLSVPRPIPTRAGTLLVTVEGYQIDMVSWLDGAPLGKTATPLALVDRMGTFRAIGREMARLHVVSDAWAPPDGFSRVAWDRDGLVGEAPLWGRFWENPTLSPAERDMLVKLRIAGAGALRAKEPTLDFGLIHADLVRENVMIAGNSVQMIDFDDGGFGFRLFDVATALIKNLAEPDYADLKTALLDGYRSLRPLDTAALDLFLALRAASYVGWIVPRMGEDGSATRNTRFVQSALRQAEAWLSTCA